MFSSVPLGIQAAASAPRRRMMGPKALTRGSAKMALDIAVARRCLMSEKKKEWQNKISDLRTLDGDFGIIDA